MVDSTSEALGKALKAFRNRKGLSRAQLAARAGVHHNQIQKLEYGERKVTVEWMERLAPLLDVTPDDILAEARAAHVKESPKIASEVETPASPVTVYLPGPPDLPILGMAECGPDGWSLWNGIQVGMTQRPGNLAGAPQAYAVYIVGSSMEPRYFAGELAHIHPGRPVHIGDFVLIQVRPEPGESTPRAIIKRLVRRSATKLTLEQYHPAKVMDLKLSEVMSMHLVVGSAKS